MNMSWLLGNPIWRTPRSDCEWFLTICMKDLVQQLCRDSRILHELACLHLVASQVWWIYHHRRRCMVVLVHYLPSFRSENSRSIGLNTTADLINLRQSVINEAYSCHPWFGDIPDEIFVLIMLEVPDEVKAWTKDTLISWLNHLLHPEESLDDVLYSFMSLKALSVRQYYERSAFVFYKRWGIDPSPSRAREIDENRRDENSNVILHVIPVWVDRHLT